MKMIYLRIVNAAIVAGITFFSTLSINYPPTCENLYAALIAFSLTFLVQAKSIVESYMKAKKGKGKNENEQGGYGKCLLVLI